MQIQQVGTFVLSRLFFHSFCNFMEHPLHEEKSLGPGRCRETNPQSFYACHTQLLLLLGASPGLPLGKRLPH